MQPKIVVNDPNATAILAKAWTDAEQLIPNEFLEQTANDYTEELLSQIRLRHRINPIGTEIRYNSLVCASFVEENHRIQFCDLMVGNKKFDDQCGLLADKSFEEIAAMTHYIYAIAKMKAELLLDLFYKKYTPEIRSSSHVENIYYPDDENDFEIENKRKHIHVVYRFDYYSIEW